MMWPRKIIPTLAVLTGLTLLSGCGDGMLGGAAQLPEVDLGAVGLAENGLPDPCEVLRTAGVDRLLVRPLDPEPMRAPGFCLLQVKRGERFELQTSAALELTLLEGAAPTSLDEYVEQFGEGLTMAGLTPDDVETLAGLGDFSIWFAHAYPPDTRAITLSSFWGGNRILSLEIHRVDPDVALAWSKEIAQQVIRRAATSAADHSDGA